MIMEKLSKLWICDDCGGAAWWTIVDGEPYYLCKSECEGSQVEQLDVYSAMCYIDRVVSVSASEEQRSELDA